MRREPARSPMTRRGGKGVEHGSSRIWKVSMVMGLLLSGLFWGCQKSKDVPPSARNPEPWYDQNAIRRPPSEDWYQTAMWLAESLPLHPNQYLELTLGERQGASAIVEAKVLEGKNQLSGGKSAQHGDYPRLTCYDEHGNVKWQKTCFSQDAYGKLIEECYEGNSRGSATIRFCNDKIQIYPARYHAINSEEEFFERLFRVLQQLRYDVRRSEAAEVTLSVSSEDGLPRLSRLTVEASPQIVDFRSSENPLKKPIAVPIFWGCDEEEVYGGWKGAPLFGSGDEGVEREDCGALSCAEVFRRAKECASKGKVGLTYYPAGYRSSCEICPPDYPFPPASSRD